MSNQDVVDGAKEDEEAIDKEIERLQKRCLDVLPEDSTRRDRVAKGLNRLKRDARLKVRYKSNNCTRYRCHQCYVQVLFCELGLLSNQLVLI